MEIASYNQHARLLSSESWSVTATKFTQSGGADAVIQSRNDASSIGYRNAASPLLWPTLR
jgi:hypothetical protein